MEKILQVAEGMEQIQVKAEESGQKLLRFLEKRLGFPQSLLHRWIRTGQIRLNGSRSKPFMRLCENDLIRIPPFVSKLKANDKEEFSGFKSIDESCTNLDIVEVWKDILFINKPADLAVHGGSFQIDTVNSRLAKMYNQASFKPVCCHRLDKNTTGLLLAGLTWQTLQSLQKNFASHIIKKEYLAWVHNKWNFSDTMEFHHFLKREKKDAYEKTCVYEAGEENVREAVTAVTCLIKKDDYSLLHLVPVTGIKHQLRSQLAFLGYPIVGDEKYGNDKNLPLLLHSFKITLPDGHNVRLLPNWTGDFELSQYNLPSLI